MRAHISLIGIVLVSMIPSWAASKGAHRRLTEAQEQSQRAEAKHQLEEWFQHAFTKCGSSWFAKDGHYSNVYELVNPTVGAGSLQYSYDDLNDLEFVRVNFTLSAEKSRVNIRGENRLWQKGFAGMLGGGEHDGEVDVGRSNAKWSVRPGAWFIQRDMHSISCDELPDAMKPAAVTGEKS